MTRTGTVTATHGNVFFCQFGAPRAMPADAERDSSAALAAVTSAVAAINADSRQIIGANVALAQLGVDNSNLLFVTLGRIDNIAFHAGIVGAHAAQPESDAGAIDAIADDVRQYITRGAAAAKRVRDLVTEHQEMLTAAGCVLRDISEQMAELEAATCARTDPVRTRMREIELANFCDSAAGAES
jgi:hypothetical protein